MARPTLHTFGTVIARQTVGESSLKIHFLSPDQGSMLLIKRISQKQARNVPDLFDDAEIVAESTDTARVWFLREYHLSQRRDSLALSYANFEAACRFTAIIEKNIARAEHAQPIHGLLCEALHAWQTHRHSEAILFKALYRLAREEGYPIKEQWFRGLSRINQSYATEILNTPLSTLKSPSNGSLSTLTNSLTQWMETHTDIEV